MTFDEWKLELEQAARGGRLTIGNLDIDNFGPLNEKFGRECGDKILKFFGEILKQNLPEKVSFVRFGDEFFVYSTEYSLENLFMEIQEIRQIIEDGKVKCNGKEITFTVSGSVGEYPRNASSIEKLLNLLSEGMRKAKEKLNQIVFAPMEREQKMVLKSNYYFKSQLDGLSKLAKMLNRTESSLLREALDDLLRKYKL
ncbi:GGDEF domain-containing protein [Kosmotoga olearia]|uniref:Diguanylate cyclase n=1 Tax=Kosmotoga olearia (strain ATCC BAA-1733 / DSM 21960 / TBF 19.5.1) TaxID=521045 RepID=C5CI35_KOSOT|nr:GGDEF domain-containing protein [Kosmotoga olearia]ACR79814.1 diguanylate cyclase [Kosmotoga olearia TBF 19.5.1]